MMLDAQSLPTSCPDWCIDDHQGALADGNPLKIARRHNGPIYERRLDHASGKRYSLRLEAQCSSAGWAGRGEIRLELAGPRTTMTSGDARVLAAQLVRLANLVDMGAEVARGHGVG